MKLSRSTNYGILAVGYIASHDSEVRSQEIAEHYNIPLEYLLKILQELVKANILTSKRGPQGGFKLAKAPSQINLLQIIEVGEGQIPDQLSFAGAGTVDKVTTKTQTQFKKVVKQAKASLKKIKLSDLVK